MYTHLACKTIRGCKTNQSIILNVLQRLEQFWKACAKFVIHVVKTRLCIQVQLHVYLNQIFPEMCEHLIFTCYLWLR